MLLSEYHDIKISIRVLAKVARGFGEKMTFLSVSLTLLWKNAILAKNFQAWRGSDGKRDP